MGAELKPIRPVLPPRSNYIVDLYFQTPIKDAKHMSCLINRNFTQQCHPTLPRSNYIVDLYFQTPIKDAKKAAAEIAALEGVVDHGLFLDMVDVCIIAGANGVEVKTRK